jgi:hypothetical protein
MPPVTQPAAKKNTPRKPTFGQTATSLALFAVELILPGLLAVGIAVWLFTYYNVWSIGAVLAQIIFFLGIILVAFMATVMLDMGTASGRNVQGVVGGGPRARLVKFALGGLVLPIALAAAVNLATLPTGNTVLETAIRLLQPAEKVTPSDEVARTAIESNDPVVKRTGIEVLVKFKTPEALAQLLRMAQEDRAALRDAATARALAQAIASFGTQARDPLLALFNSIDPTDAGGGLPDDMYGRYFDTPFSGLEEEVKANDPDRLAQVESARAQLESALQDLHAASTGGATRDPRPIFILQTFQAMNLSSDKDLLAFALQVAGDARYNAAVRGEALLLVGQLGQAADLNGVYEFLNSNDPFIQTRALQAISAILSKGNPAPK